MSDRRTLDERRAWLSREQVLMFNPNWSLADRLRVKRVLDDHAPTMQYMVASRAYIKVYEEDPERPGWSKAYVCEIGAGRIDFPNKRSAPRDAHHGVPASSIDLNSESNRDWVDRLTHRIELSTHQEPPWGLAAENSEPVCPRCFLALPASRECDCD